MASRTDGAKGVVALQPLCAEQQILIGQVEVDMRRRQVVVLHMADDGLDQRTTIYFAASQQTWPGDRRVGHAAQPLWEVLQPVPGISIGPGMIEHELAMRVLLQIARRGGDKLFAAPQAQMLGLPAPFRAQAAMLLQSAEEGVADEGVAAVMQAIPLRGAQRCKVVQDAKLQRQVHGSNVSTSMTGGLNRRNGRPISPVPLVVKTRIGPQAPCMTCSPRSKP